MIIDYRENGGRLIRRHKLESLSYSERPVYWLISELMTKLRFMDFDRRYGLEFGETERRDEARQDSGGIRDGAGE